MRPFVMLEREITTDSPAQDIPAGGDFWQSPTLEELAQAQGVSPIADVRVLFGTWPGEPDDGFEALIDELRHPRAIRG